MKRKKVGSKIEQQLITSLIVSKEFLSQAISILDPKLIRGDHLRLVASWCVKYFNKYGKAPGRHIENIFAHWVDSGNAKEETIEAVQDLLERFSEEYDESQLNVPYLLDCLGEYLTFQKLERLKDQLEGSILEGKREDAESAVFGYSSVNVGQGKGIDFLRDEEAWDRAYADSQKPLFQFNNKNADRFFRNAFVRDGLIAILGPEKRGKTFWCVEFAMRALMCRCTVALFEVGDMSESQIMRRLGCRLSRRPMFPHQCGTIEIPRMIHRGEKETEIDTVPIDFPRTATAKSSKMALKKFMRRYGLSPKYPYFMGSIHPNSSINIAGISGVLDRWEVENGFIPDVVIIDYPDILDVEPDTRHFSTRDQINATWKAMRRLSQERHCLVIAPTQADASSYSVNTLDMNNFSEDKRKFAHVTGMMGLNQTEKEKEKGLMRLNWIVLREDTFVSSRCLHIAQCLPLGRAFCCSIF